MDSSMDDTKNMQCISDGLQHLPKEHKYVPVSERGKPHSFQDGGVI